MAENQRVYGIVWDPNREGYVVIHSNEIVSLLLKDRMVYWFFREGKEFKEKSKSSLEERESEENPKKVRKVFFLMRFRLGYAEAHQVIRSGELPEPREVVETIERILKS